MTATLLVIHVLLAIALVGVILLQRTSSDGGGLMGGSSNMGGLMSVRGTANLLTRITGFLAAAFIATSILLTIVGGTHKTSSSIVDQIAPQSSTNAVPAKDGAVDATGVPATPSVPVSK
jgi:preprotein translocase subunit SecG